MIKKFGWLTLITVVAFGLAACNTTPQLSDDAQEKVGEVMDDAKGVAGDKVDEVMDEVKEEGEEMVKKASDEVEEAVGEVVEKED